ncbi:MAG: hypothetical protein QXK63_04115, partial [Thermoproteus sp.]
WSAGVREVEGGFEVAIGVVMPSIRPYPRLGEATVLGSVALESIKPNPMLVKLVEPIIRPLNGISLGDVAVNVSVEGMTAMPRLGVIKPVIRDMQSIAIGDMVSVAPRIQVLPMPSSVEPQIAPIREVQRADVISDTPKISTHGHGTSVVRPLVRSAQTLTPTEAITDVPKVLAPAGSSQTQASAVERASDYDEYTSLVDSLVEAYSRDPILGFVGRVLADRPLLVIARRGDFDYIEFLKRLLREVFRVRVGGLPRPRHVSRELASIDVNDMPSYELLETKAGGYVYVVDARGFKADSEEDRRRLGRLLASVVFTNRLLELFSQGFGFLVIYQNKDLSVAPALGPYQRPVVVEASSESFYRRVAKVMWGFVEGVDDAQLDYYVVEAEDEFYKALEGVVRDFDVFLATRPNAEPEGQGLGAESSLHYLTKAAVVKYLIDEIVGELARSGYDREKARDLALKCVDTEHVEGNVRFDVYVRPNCGSLSGLVVEVETLYGTGTVVHKLADTIESRLKAGVNKLWIVIPNPTFAIYLPEIARLWLRYRRMYGDKLEVKTLRIKPEESKAKIELIDVRDAIREIVGAYESR